MREEQVPPHDSDPRYCRSLNEDEQNELRIFNEQQQHNALGPTSARQLPLTQSPIPCCGVSLRISYSSFKD
jgi:prickle